MPEPSDGKRAEDTVLAAHLNCPRCGLTFNPKARRPTIEDCPRCLARSHIPVRMFASTLPVDELYAAGCLPSGDRGDPPSPASDAIEQDLPSPLRHKTTRAGMREAFG